MSRESALKTVVSKLKRAHKLLQAETPQPDMPVRVEVLLEEAIADLEKALGIQRWPRPTTERPDLETLEEWMMDEGMCEATDGCVIEPDGICPHGHPSWLLRLGLI